MGAESNRNLLITGIGSSNGGHVREAKIDGVGKIDGDIRCTNFVVHGQAEVLGSVQAASAEMDGMTVIAGDLHAGRTQMKGRTRVGGNLTGDTVEIDGTLIVKGSCEAETFRANGKVQMGALNADTVELTIHGSCSIAEIGGAVIRVQKQHGIGFTKWLRALPSPMPNKLTAQAIEGDQVELAFTTAEVVRGANVRIGPECDIQLVEYTGKFEQDQNAVVKRFKQI